MAETEEIIEIQEMERSPYKPEMYSPRQDDGSSGDVDEYEEESEEEEEGTYYSSDLYSSERGEDAFYSNESCEEEEEEGEMIIQGCEQKKGIGRKRSNEIPLRSVRLTNREEKPPEMENEDVVGESLSNQSPRVQEIKETKRKEEIEVIIVEKENSVNTKSKSPSSSDDEKSPKKFEKLDLDNATPTRNDFFEDAFKPDWLATPLNCVVIGDPKVGKTSVISSIIQNSLSSSSSISSVSSTQSTKSVQPLYVDGMMHNVYVDKEGLDGERLETWKIPIILNEWNSWDVGRAESLTQLNTCFIVCFSLDRPETYESLKKTWFKRLKKQFPKHRCVVVGTHFDKRPYFEVDKLYDYTEPMDFDTIKKEVEDHNNSKYYEYDSITLSHYNNPKYYKKEEFNPKSSKKLKKRKKKLEKEDEEGEKTHRKETRIRNSEKGGEGRISKFDMIQKSVSLCPIVIKYRRVERPEPKKIERCNPLYCCWMCLCYGGLNPGLNMQISSCWCVCCCWFLSFFLGLFLIILEPAFQKEGGRGTGCHSTEIGSVVMTSSVLHMIVLVLNCCGVFFFTAFLCCGCRNKDVSNVFLRLGNKCCEFWCCWCGQWCSFCGCFCMIVVLVIFNLAITGYSYSTCYMDPIALPPIFLYLLFQFCCCSAPLWCLWLVCCTGMVCPPYMKTLRDRKRNIKKTREFKEKNVDEINWSMSLDVAGSL